MGVFPVKGSFNPARLHKCKMLPALQNDALTIPDIPQEYIVRP